MKFFGWGLTMLLFFFGSFCLQGQVLADRAQKEIESICDSLGVEGLRVVVIKDTCIVGDYKYGKGVHRVAGKVRFAEFQNNDLWRVASVTKNVIAFAIMQLVDCGILALDTNVNDYLPYKIINPDYPDVPITVRMLLSHRSSIAHSQYTSPKGIVYDSIAPGTTYNYSNLNYLLLASIMECMTQERFDKYVQKHIFAPIGVKGVFNPYEEDWNKYIYGMWFDKKNDKLSFCDTYRWYNKDSIDNYRLVSSTKCLNPAGGLIISVNDLAKYVMLNINDGRWNGKQIISSNSIKLMRIPLSSKIKYGLGTIDYSRLIKGERLYGHTGFSLGIYSCVVYNPERKYGFVILCNGVKIDYPKAFDKLHGPIIKKMYQTFLHFD